MILRSTERGWYLKGAWDLERFMSDGRRNSALCASGNDLEEGKRMLQRRERTIAGAMSSSRHSEWDPVPKWKVV